jgi:hypothetical protein
MNGDGAGEPRVDALGRPTWCPPGACPVRAAGLTLPCPCASNPRLGALVGADPATWGPKAVALAGWTRDWEAAAEPGRPAAVFTRGAAAGTGHDAVPAVAPPPAGRRAAPAPARSTCRHLGDPIEGEGGEQATRRCGTCRGEVRLKLWACLHPGHEGRPETTARECSRCPDYEAGGAGQKAEGTAGMNEGINYWRGGS